MRIIAGKYKSRLLAAPRGSKTRPTTDRARESLFNVLENTLEFEGIQVLDLFAGSGALGFESLSRGAGSVTFVEKNRDAQSAILSNARSVGAEAQINLIRGDVYRTIHKLAARFDLIFADAPYEDVHARAELPLMIVSEHLLSDDGTAVIEHRSSDSIDLPEGAALLRRMEAGEAAFSMFRLKLISK